MNDDLVKRLREIGKFSFGWTANQAADRIEALTAERDEAKALAKTRLDLARAEGVWRVEQFDRAEKAEADFARQVQRTDEQREAYKQALSVMEAERDRLIRAGDLLSVCAQTTGGTAGRDNGLVDAIQGWGDARAALNGETT